MKGLLLKDWYAVRSYCRSMIFLIVVISVLGGITEGSPFLMYYPCIFAGIAVVNLIAYEEKEKWEQYAAALPYTKAQLVSSKYLVSLCFGLFAVLFSLLVQLACMAIRHSLDVGQLLVLLTVSFPLALLPNTILLPLIYQFGVNKGRIAYYVIIGVFCAVAVTLTGIPAFRDMHWVPESQIGIVIAVLAVSLAAYALSWGISVRLYRKREL